MDELPSGEGRPQPSHESRLSRRTFLGTSAGAAAVAAAGLAAPGGVAAAAGRSSAPPTPSDVLLLVNGRIHTMDGSGSMVSDVAIRGDRFIPFERSLRRGRDTRVINLRGRTVVPGIIDNHNHIVLMGNRPGFHTPLENAYSVADVQATLGARAAAGVPAGSWVTTIGGFHFNQFAERRLPTLAELDAAAPNHPVYLSISFSGPSVTNTPGKAALESAPLPVTVAADGSIAAGEQTGRATLYLRQSLLTNATRRRGAIDAMAYGAGLGVTTHLDQGAFQKTDTPADGAAHEDNFTMHLPFLELYREGALGTRLRINFLHMESDPATPELLARLRNAFPFFGNDL